MKRKLLTIFFVFALALYPLKVHAACSTAMIAEFKEHEAEFKTTYNMNLSNEKYTVYLYTPLPEKFDYIAYVGTDIRLEMPDEYTNKLYDVPAGKYQISIVGLKNGCEDKPFKTFTLVLPEPNKYSKSELCEGIEEFVLCQPDYDKEITYEDFVSRTNTYRNTKAKEEANKKEEKASIIDNVTEFVENNLTRVIIVTVFIVILIISVILWIISYKKSRRLE